MTLAVSVGVAGRTFALQVVELAEPGSGRQHGEVSGGGFWWCRQDVGGAAGSRQGSEAAGFGGQGERADLVGGGQRWEAGLTLCVRELLAELAGIQETVLLYQADRVRPRARRMLTDLSPTRQRLFDLFNLDRYAPRR